MPRQNRVLPTGEIVADPARGLFTGNRGCLHNEQGVIRRRWTTKAWICCRLDWKGRRRQIMAPGRWTELFFLDEAVALAAGHRPCAACRHADFQRFRACWPGTPRAPAMDAALRKTTPRHRRARPEILPDGAFVLAAEGPALVLGGRLRRYRPSGYGAELPGAGPLPLITTDPILAVLQAGYRPVLHPSARDTWTGLPTTDHRRL